MKTYQTFSKSIKPFFSLRSYDSLWIKDQYWENRLGPLLSDEDLKELQDYAHKRILEPFGDNSFEINMSGTRRYTVQQYFFGPDPFKTFTRMRIFCEKQLDCLSSNESNYQIILKCLYKMTNWSHHNEMNNSRCKRLEKDDLFATIDLFEYLLNKKFQQN
ncbi:hypothetical protein M0812_18559 [Anaeramoeba flamelloides]|uniref:Uncharacterized protein n=1 Tax=Anaeramoeba flamelloides TaxID=1746091 RepID=A0AAV7Z310_9EUKA|nr:hypothetical protein M0812_18559 [Anaeramoeba flamelloides]